MQYLLSLYIKSSLLSYITGLLVFASLQSADSTNSIPDPSISYRQILPRLSQYPDHASCCGYGQSAVSLNWTTDFWSLLPVYSSWHTLILLWWLWNHTVVHSGMVNIFTACMYFPVLEIFCLLIMSDKVNRANLSKQG